MELYEKKEIEKHGQVWTHGDYWLSNYVGKRVGDNFELEAVIDWETAKLTTPYEDFATVLMSIEQTHPNSSAFFWHGYGIKPIHTLQQHFAVLKTLEWMRADKEAQEDQFTSPFYATKIQMLKRLL
jgi:aminoglycoside phosphotransferase (APT) family kinase protein